MTYKEQKAEYHKSSKNRIIISRAQKHELSRVLMRGGLGNPSTSSTRCGSADKFTEQRRLKCYLCVRNAIEGSMQKNEKSEMLSKPESQYDTTDR